MPHRTTILILVLACLGLGSAARAQEPQVVENPFQKEFEYRVGTVMQPELVVGGMLWHALRIEAKEGKELEPGREVPVTMSVEYENTGDSKAAVLTIILLEDERGRQLGRIEAGSVKVAAGRVKDHRKKLKMDGGVLSATRKVWVFIEVVR